MAVKGTTKTAAVKEEAKTAEEKTVKKTTARKPAAKKETAKKVEEVKEAAKAAEVKEAPAKKAPAKKTVKVDADVKTTVNFQFDGKSYTTEDLLKSCRDVWKYDLSGDEKDIKSIELYVKPEESVTYYVINGEVRGSFFI
ncbi:MAG: DUF6465 family protein [Clostridium sp.]|nr:DUF6465 family protein [Clostridium sp.]